MTIKGSGNSKQITGGAEIDLMARILCYGVKVPPDVERAWALSIDKGFIQGTTLMFDNKRPLNTAFIESMVQGSNAVDLEVVDGDFYVRAPTRLVPCTILTQPKQIMESVAGIGPIGKYIRLHSPNTYFGVPVRECVFGYIGKQCRFCTFERTKPSPLPPSVFAEMFEVVRNGAQNVALALGPGTVNLNDYGAGYIAKIIGALRKRWDGPLSVEIIPPPERELGELISLGVKSLIMSIEIWDDDIRTFTCPGKSIVRKELYLDRWAAAVGKLGRGRVSSVFLVGLEPEESLLAGIDAATSLGIVPTLIPYRPYDDVVGGLGGLTDHTLYMRVSKYNIERMLRSGIGPAFQQGCTKCGGCSLDMESSESFRLK